MAFDYGSQGIAIRNPFRLEGFLGACRGAVFAVLGVLLLLTVRDRLVQGGAQSGWTQLGVGVVLLILGLAALSVGLLRLFRFYVGRSMPSDLAATGNAGHHPVYSLKGLQDMLMGRKNMTFQEPRAWLERLLLTLVRGFLYLPAPLRRNLEQSFEAVTLSLVVLILYGFALFSGSTGLTSVTSSAVGAWLGWVMFGGILWIWFIRRPRQHWLRAQYHSSANIFTLARWIVFAVLAPAVLVLVNKQHPLPTPPIAPGAWLFLISLLAVLTFAYAFFMAWLRKPVSDPLTEVSEYRSQWQESMHPMDIFRAVDMSLADYRFQEIPNRVYEKHDPQLVQEDKGSFSGSMVQEIQPIPLADQRSPLSRLGLWVGQGSGQLLLLLAGVVLFMMVKRYPASGMDGLIMQLLSMVLLGLFGSHLVATAHSYAAEILFESRIVHFFANGTFTRSKISTGMSIHDSTRSENEVVRSNLTPWVLSSRLITSTFAVSGSLNLEQYRYIVEMQKHDDFLSALIGDLRRFIESRQIVANVQSNADLQAAGQMHQLNEATRARTAPSPQEQLGYAARREEGGDSTAQLNPPNPG